jgi:hypothetical protein
MRYSCEVCGERFFVHGHMKRHLYSHTGIKPHCCRFAALVFLIKRYEYLCTVIWLLGFESRKDQVIFLYANFIFY